MRIIKKMLATMFAIVLMLGLIGGICNPSAANAKSKKISISKKKLTMIVGEKAKLKLKNISKKQAKTVKWTSSKKKVATVKAGVVTAKKAGKSTITATYKKKKYTCKVTVEMPPMPVDPEEKTKYELFTEDANLRCNFDPGWFNESENNYVFKPADKYNKELAKCSLATAILSESVIIPSDNNGSLVPYVTMSVMEIVVLIVVQLLRRKKL